MIAAPAGDGVRTRTHVLVGAGFALFVLLSHATFLKLPFFWDELGQFVPAALDIFREGAWIPHSTVPNVHPPGVMAYLAAVWTVAGGYSIAATRMAMLALGATGVVITLRLGIRLGLSRGAAVLAAGFLCISPLFFAQAMMAQLDMPAMVFFSLALLLFLDGRMVPAALACTALVLVKETGIVAPALFGAWLCMERHRREALWFVLPILPLLIWLIALERNTGHLFGNAAFATYNLWYPLHPVRLILALVRRLYYLFAGSGHCIGTAAVVLALRRTKIFGTREWRIAAALAAAHVVLVSLLGGAELERYLLPAMPIVYIGFAAALCQASVRLRVAGAGAILAALLTANFVNPPYPFPLENNLAFTDFVGLHAEAGRYLEVRFPDAKIAAMFPLASELRRPDFGYVQRPLHVREIYNCSAENVAPLAREDVAVLLLYSETWDLLGLMRNPRWTAFLRRYYEYELPVNASQVRVLLGAQLVARWTRHGQWIEIYKR